MIRIAKFIGAVALAAMLPPVAHAQTVLFRDDFNGPAGADADSANWTAENFVMQRTKFSGLGKLDGQGNVRLAVTSRASKDGTQNIFGGTNMYTNQKFKWQQGKTIEIRARIKIPHNKKGLVHSIFTYEEANDAAGVKRSNEFDFEWLTNNTASTTNDKVLVSSYKNFNNKVSDFGYYINDPVKGTHIFGTVDQPDTANWQTYVMRWSKDKIEFLIDGGVVWSLAQPGVSSDKAVPVFLNSWVPGSTWAEAYNASTKPSARGAPVTTWNMLVDYVEVVQL